MGVVPGGVDDVVARLREALAPHVERADFVLVEVAEDPGASWLEYRQADNEPTVLGLYVWPQDRLIVAELWGPAELAGALRAGAAAPVRTRRWRWWAGEDPLTVIVDVAASVGEWLGRV
jgi:hypothetical protein